MYAHCGNWSVLGSHSFSAEKLALPRYSRLQDAPKTLQFPSFAPGVEFYIWLLLY